MTFEEGTSAAWLYDLLKPHVANVLVCDPRKNALLKDGSKSDRIDARKLAELLRGIFRFGFLQDGDVRVGVFPRREEILVGGERPDAGGIGSSAQWRQNSPVVVIASAMRLGGQSR